MSQKTGRNLRRAISTARILRSDALIDDRPAPMAMGRAEPIGTTGGKLNSTRKGQKDPKRGVQHEDFP